MKVLTLVTLLTSIVALSCTSVKEVIQPDYTAEIEGVYYPYAALLGNLYLEEERNESDPDYLKTTIEATSKTDISINIDFGKDVTFSVRLNLKTNDGVLFTSSGSPQSSLKIVKGGFEVSTVDSGSTIVWYYLK